MVDLFVDIGSCPVFPQMVQAARWHSLELYVVTRDYLNVGANVHLIFADDDVGAGAWIATNISRHDICVTDDRTLAMTCILRGATALDPSGRAWSGSSANPAVPLGKTTTGGSPSLARCLDMAIVAARSAGRRSAVPAGLRLRA